jgi:hypothetical protein
MMADSPVAAASPSVPGPHQETESEQGTTESEEETESEPGLEAPPGVDATKTDSDSDGEDGSGQDAASVETTTTDLFSKNESHEPGLEPESKQHKLGLDINEPWYVQTRAALYSLF